MKVKMKNLKGEDTKEALLPKEIFGVEAKPGFLNQVLSIQLGNRKQNTASVKGRSQVRGGGRKPWRQKGTGRARAGSIRSPLWKGGGVTFGPEGSSKRKLSRRMKRKSLLSALSLKAKDKEIILLEKLELEKPKTKLMSQILKKIAGEESVLMVTPIKDDNVFKAARNIPRVSVVPAAELNLLDILSFKYLVITKEGVKAIKETFLK